MNLWTDRTFFFIPLLTSQQQIGKVLTSLLVSKYEVDPLVQLTADELGLERHPVDPDELFGGRGPGRQDDVTGRRVLNAQPVPRAVHQHLGQEEQLRDQLLREQQRNVSKYLFSECGMLHCEVLLWPRFSLLTC